MRGDDWRGLKDIEQYDLAHGTAPRSGESLSTTVNVTTLLTESYRDAIADLYDRSGVSFSSFSLGRGSGPVFGFRPVKVQRRQRGKPRG